MIGVLAQYHHPDVLQRCQVESAEIFAALGENSLSLRLLSSQKIPQRLHIRAFKLRSERSPPAFVHFYLVAHPFTFAPISAYCLSDDGAPGSSLQPFPARSGRRQRGSRSEERSVGNKCVSTCRYRWPTLH